MGSGPVTVEEWKELHAADLIDCRWGCRMTRAACRSYQARRDRYIIHFNGQPRPYPRVNADYLRCVYPEPCAFLISDDEVAQLRADRGLEVDGLCQERRNRESQARDLDHLSNPEPMLGEPQWARSLVKK
ncbi:MAG: hypothetical protein P8182_12415 [Deltaproteobacteria bacterium]